MSLRTDREEHAIRRPILAPLRTVPARAKRNLTVPDVVPRPAIDTAPTHAVVIEGKVFTTRPVTAPSPQTIGARNQKTGLRVNDDMSLLQAWQTTCYASCTSLYGCSIIGYHCTSNWGKTCCFCAEDTCNFFRSLCDNSRSGEEESGKSSDQR
jgi:hypothetical protein